MELLERKTKELEDRLQVAESKISQLVTDKSCKMSDVVEDKKENKAGIG
jgi:flagellar hook-basal body complex protein FliE